MKKRKVMSVLIILIAVAVLGIGYASITTSLSLNGTATAAVNTDAFDVEFTASENLTDPGDDEIVTDISYTPTVATFTAVLDSDHSTASAQYTITNLSPELKAAISMGSMSVTGDTAYFSVTPTFTDIPASNALAPNGTTTLTIQVDLIKTPVEQKQITITIPFTATAVEA